VDVARCSFLDLAVIGTDTVSVRRAMRPSATLVVNDDHGATALGPFGEVKAAAPRGERGALAFAERCTAAICAEYARPRGLGETPSARWHRVLTLPHTTT
jgi:hypothetical protein